MRMVTGTTSPSTRYERISVSPASCSIKSEYVIASHAFKPQYKCINYIPAWEQRKFGDCFEFLKSNTLSRAGLNGENGTARNVHYGDILIKFGDCLDGERSDLPFITDDTVLPKYAGSILREGDVIFADTAEDETAGKSVELRKLPKEPTISGLHTIPARPRFPFGTGYLGHYLNSDAYHRQLLPLMQGIKVISVSKAALQDTQVRFPGLSEQSAIGAALNEIDSLITLHQRKYDKLVVFKKSMLEKMFPKDGESVPEIRFAGFTDPWEQRKLGELEKDATLYMGRGRVISAKDMSNTPGTFPVYSSSALDNGRMGAYGKYMFNQELITWSIDGGGAVFYRRKHRFSVTNVSGYIAVNPEKINCKFLAYAMSLAHSRIKFDYTVKAHPSVIRSLYTMGIPISLQEQQVIGSFFSRLDNLITLHQRKLELLRNIKKSLLDKMFV